ncbi:unannotated protein [freshwater metagenome]|uniref:Unannotated protein n=1 Tax=freshwater metagenome TaxID=449393 RepID=A0A6J7XV85_9ZZZZ
MHQLERTSRVLKNGYGTINICNRAHAGGDEGMFFFRSYHLQQCLIHQHRGSDLIVFKIKLAHEFLTIEIPSRSEPFDILFTTVTIDFPVLIYTEL